MADELSVKMMRDPDLALETHAREELGYTPGQTGRPLQAAASSFVTFALGAFIPLLPWLFTAAPPPSFGRWRWGPWPHWWWGRRCRSSPVGGGSGRPDVSC